ncbi:MAG: hypothetical protein CR997_06805 [Acidobacteria bacterium]|nr:MAG: hypothetical protein CR997_06805 [Acidobacteriota bacterium]
MTALFLIFLLQDLELKPRILEPQPGAFLSGKVELRLACNQPGQVARMEIQGNGDILLKTDGWKESVIVNFGHQIQAWRLVLCVFDQSGRQYRSEVVPTRALHIDVEQTTRIILIPVMVKDRKNRNIPNLLEEQFRVFQDGQPCRIRLLERRTVPLNLVLTVDASSSLRKNQRQLKQAVLDFLAQLDSGDRAALISFNNEARLVFGFDAARQQIEDSLNVIQPRGATAMFDALLLGIEKLKYMPRSRKTLVLFTDGRDSVYEEVEEKRNMFKQVVQQAQQQEIAIFSIGLGENIHHEALELMSWETGGRFLFAASSRDLQARFKEVLRDLKSQYILHVEPASEEKGFHKLEVKVKKRRARVFARRGFTIE